MQDTAFSKIAHYYDIYSGALYEEYRDFIVGLLKKQNAPKVTDILDLGCGTGKLTGMLSRCGYGMIGVDSSGDMLAEAKSNHKDILFLQQDMREFELYGTVQAAICTYDGLNYLQSTADLEKVFFLLHNYLEKDCLFIFDVNTLYKYQKVLAQNAFVYENGDDMLIWQNYYNEKTKKCDFYLTLFEETGDGKYVRSDEFQRQKYFSHETIKKTAKKCGFDIISVYGGTDGSPLGENSEKAFYVIKRGA